MELPRFMIAKCIPDVFRNEPRNVGVVLWSPDGVAARFLGERPDAPGEVDDGEVPPFVASAEVYRQWVRYWRREITQESIRPAAGGAPVPRSSPAFLDALSQTGPGSFQLADGGMLAEAIPAGELSSALDYLFANYVAEPVAAESGTLRSPARGEAGAAAPGRTPVNLPTPFPSGRTGKDPAHAALFKRIAVILGVDQPGESGTSDASGLRAENNELRSLLEETRDRLQDSSAAEEQLAAREDEYRAALAALGARIKELGGAGDHPGEGS